ncbi:MAG TPA: alpha/beta hydrolase [Mycobacterium sp.]|nr:alpha/beta hydrolase [Mycobacterium sp.]
MDSLDMILIHGSGSTGEQLAVLRDNFQQCGWNVHVPTLRHHDATVGNQAELVAGVSLRDYADDVAQLAGNLNRPLIGGFSMGGLIAQLVASRVAHRGLFCVAPAPGPGMLAPLREALVLGRHFVEATPWRKPIAPSSWEDFRRCVANEQDETAARKLHNNQVFESGRVFAEVYLPHLDHGHAARVDYQAETGPVLVIGGSKDRIVSTNVCRQTAAHYPHGQYVEIDGADHMLVAGRFVATVLHHLHEWIADNQLTADQHLTQP